MSLHTRVLTHSYQRATERGADAESHKMTSARSTHPTPLSRAHANRATDTQDADGGSGP